MSIINATAARNRFFKLMEETIATNDIVTITGKPGNIIMMSEADYNAIQETLFLNSNKELRESILEGKRVKPEDCVTLEDLGWDID